jgi:excisionase family DNA binding protein
MSVVEVKTIEPAALSPNGAAAYLSLSKRAIYLLIAGDKIIARRDGARTLVDFESIKAYYKSLPLKTVAASIPNAPQSSARRRTRGARR